MTNYDMDEIRRRGELPAELIQQKLTEREKKSRGIETENDWEDLRRADEYAIAYEKNHEEEKRKKRNEFMLELEEEIGNVWSTAVDLDTIRNTECEADELRELLYSLKQIHDARMQQLWNVFESGFDKYKYKQYNQES